MDSFFPSHDLSLGHKGKDVTRLQQILARLGYDVSENGRIQNNGINGVFSQTVETAVRKFQKDQGLQVNGIVSTSTINRLNHELNLGVSTHIPSSSVLMHSNAAQLPAKNLLASGVQMAINVPDPKRLLLVLYDKSDPITGIKQSAVGVQTGSYSSQLEEASKQMSGGNPTMYSLQKHELNDKDAMLRAIEAHVKKHGTLQELTVTGHGSTNHIGTGGFFSDSVDYRDFLRGLKKLQDTLGVKIAHRIQSDACALFNDISSDDRDFYRSMAKTLHAEIAGATTIVAAGKEPSTGEIKHGAYFVKFTADGKIVRDKWHAPETYKEVYEYLGKEAKLMQFLIPGDATACSNEEWLPRDLRPSCTPTLPERISDWLNK